MDLNQKLDIKKYVLLTFINFSFAPLLGSDQWMYLAQIVIFSAFNQILLFKIMQTVLDTSGKEKSSIKIIVYFLLKTLFLGGAFYILVRYARELVVFAMLLYIFQLIILILSIKNIASLFNKKGPKP